MQIINVVNLNADNYVRAYNDRRSVYLRTNVTLNDYFQIKRIRPEKRPEYFPPPKPHIVASMLSDLSSPPLGETSEELGSKKDGLSLEVTEDDDDIDDDLEKHSWAPNNYWPVSKRSFPNAPSYKFIKKIGVTLLKKKGQLCDKINSTITGAFVMIAFSMTDF